MKWKEFLLMGVWFMVFQGLQAQSFGENRKISEDKSNIPLQTQIQVSMGTSFSTFYPGMNTFGSWIAPSVHIPVNKKWSFTAGLSYANIMLSGTPEIAGVRRNVQSYGTIYLEGHYKINEKLTVTAAGYKTFSLAPRSPAEKVNPRAVDFSNSGVMMRWDYKVNDHFRINASFSMEKRSYPFYPGYGYGGIGSYNRTPVFAPFPGSYYPGF